MEDTRSLQEKLEELKARYSSTYLRSVIEEVDDEYIRVAEDESNDRYFSASISLGSILRFVRGKARLTRQEIECYDMPFQDQYKGLREICDMLESDLKRLEELSDEKIFLID